MDTKKIVKKVKVFSSNKKNPPENRGIVENTIECFQGPTAASSF